MASGFGAKGRTGRCWLFWQDFDKCITGSKTPSECWKEREDYFECLHHKKEFTRRNQVAQERARQEAEAKSGLKPRGGSTPESSSS